MHQCQLVCFVVLGVLLLMTVDIHISDPSGPRNVTFPMAACDCWRTIETIPTTAPYQMTTCGSDAYHRGDNQLVIAFSLHGKPGSHRKFSAFIDGIGVNVARVAKFYPGWVMRLYHELDHGDHFMADLCWLACRNNHFDLCHAGKLPGVPMVDATNLFPKIWRFMPTLDTQVQKCHCCFHRHINLAMDIY